MFFLAPAQSSRIGGVFGTEFDHMLILGLLVVIIVLLVRSGRIRVVWERFTSMLPLEEFGQMYAGAKQNDGIQPDFIRNGVCHPKCCVADQWPVAHMDGVDNIDLTGKVKTGYSCRSCSNGVGCMCVNKKDADILNGTDGYRKASS